jgi:GMP synthase (glutamine-hydrolysing)
MTESEIDSIEFLRIPEKPSENQLVLVIDMDGQFAAQIMRKLHNLGINAVLVNASDVTYEQAKQAGHVVVSGGSKSVLGDDAVRIDPQIFTDPGINILGICYGLQLMTQELGGVVASSGSREDQMTELYLVGESPLFSNYKGKRVLSTHGQTVTEVPDGFLEIGRTDAGIAAMSNADGSKVGVQFHPEERSEDGNVIFENLLVNMWGLHKDEAVVEYNTPLNRVKRAFRGFLAKYMGEDLVLFLSGGVDSSGAGAACVAAGIDPTKLRSCLIDNGLMRTGEAEQAQTMLVNAGLPVVVYDAEQEFLHGKIEIDVDKIIDGKKVTVREGYSLDKTVDPELKRKICGEWFIKFAFENIPEILGLDLEKCILVQGTTETDAKESETIKSHHNAIGIVKRLKELGRVFEPLLDAMMVKDEVREVARALGLPDELVNRQPFPGPGLAIRIICNDKPELFDHLNRELEYTSFDHARITLPVRSVGVQGDERTYKHPKAVFGPSLKDAEEWARFVDQSGARIPSEDESVNRGVFVFGEEPSQIEHTELFVNEESLAKLRAADDIVNTWQKKYGYDKTIAQMPVILVPLKFDRQGEESIVLRPFITNNFKTGRPAVPGIDIDLNHFDELLAQLHELPWLSRVIFDMSSKPPGTTEWE